MTVPIRYSELKGSQFLRAWLRPSGGMAAVSELERIAGEAGAPNARAFALNSGRAALGLALRAMAAVRPERTRVVLPAYVCPSVEQLILREGLEIVRAPVGPDLNLEPAGLAELLEDDVLAVLVAHMYGCPARVEATVQAAEPFGVFVIDDAAHCFSLPGDAPAPGTGGHAGVYSFAMSKAVSNGHSGRGGILRVHDADLLEQIAPVVTALPRARPGAADDLRFVVACLHEGGFARLPWPVQQKVGAVLARGASDPWQAARIAARDAELALLQIRQLPEARARREERLQSLLAALPDTPGYWVPQRAQAAMLTRLAVCLRREVPLDALKALAAAVGFRLRMGYPARVEGIGTVFELPFGAPWPVAALGRLRSGLDRLAEA